MVPCHTKEAKSLTHEVTVNHDKYKVVKGTFVTEEGKCDKKQRVTLQTGAQVEPIQETTSKPSDDTGTRFLIIFRISKFQPPGARKKATRRSPN